MGELHLVGRRLFMTPAARDAFEKGERKETGRRTGENGRGRHKYGGHL